MTTIIRSILLGAVLLQAPSACSDDPAPLLDASTADSLVRLDGARDGGADSAGDAAVDAVGDLTPDGPLPPGKWKTITGAPPQRTGHTATLLDTGEVLIVGGSNSLAASTTLDTAVRFRPPQESFVNAGKLATARTNHAAARLPDGRVLITGGEGASYLSSAEIFDPTQPAASAFKATVSMFKSRWGHTATALKSGEILIAGGFVASGSTVSISIYDPKAGSWKVPAAQMKEGRRFHTATLLANGKVLLAGGIQGASSSSNKTTYLNSMELYDPKSGTMTQLKAQMSKKRVHHTATLMADGRILIVGGWCGNECSGDKYVDDIYDPITDTLTPLPHAGPLPSSHAATLLKDGRVLVVGDGSKTKVANILTYHDSGGGWVKQPDMAQGRWSATATLLKDGSVLVVGGRHASNPTAYADKAELFIP